MRWMPVSTLVSVACLGLSACAEPAYFPPSSGPRAQLILPANTPAAVALMQDAQLCQKRTWIAGNSNTVYLKEMSTQTLPANQLVTLYFYAARYSRQCTAVASFTPKAGQRYEFSAIVKPKGFMSSLNDDLGDCTFSLTNADNHQAVALTARSVAQPFVAQKGCDDALSNNQATMPQSLTVVAPMTYKKNNL